SVNDLLARRALPIGLHPTEERGHPHEAEIAPSGFAHTDERTVGQVRVDIRRSPTRPSALRRNFVEKRRRAPCRPGKRRDGGGGRDERVVGRRLHLRRTLWRIITVPVSGSPTVKISP